MYPELEIKRDIEKEKKQWRNFFRSKIFKPTDYVKSVKN